MLLVLEVLDRLLVLELELSELVELALDSSCTHTKMLAATDDDSSKNFA